MCKLSKINSAPTRTYQSLHVGSRLKWLLLFIVAQPIQVPDLQATQEHAPKIPAECRTMTTPQEVLDSALSRHPESQRAQLSVDRSEYLEEAAGQRPNPEVDARLLFGRAQGNVVDNQELSVLVPIELGGKRKARLERARAEKGLVSAQSVRSREVIALDTLRSLYRIRQAKEELHTIQEALDTFGRIQRQFKDRLRHTPEQEVSIGIFDLAEGDYQLRKAALETEIIVHQRELELSIGCPFTPQKNLLPKRTTHWPRPNSLAPSRPTETPRSPQTRESSRGALYHLADANLKLAQSELLTAETISWPTLRLGPSVESQTSGGQTTFSIGISVTFDLPLFQVNGGGRSLASAGVDLALQSLRLRELELANQRQIYLRRYETLVNALKGSLSHLELEKKHQNTDSLFARGLIPTSLVIEAHRQIVDFTKNQNEQELAALEALWQLSALDGQILRGSIL